MEVFPLEEAIARSRGVACMNIHVYCSLCRPGDACYKLSREQAYTVRLLQLLD